MYSWIWNLYKTSTKWVSIWCQQETLETKTKLKKTTEHTKDTNGRYNSYSNPPNPRNEMLWIKKSRHEKWISSYGGSWLPTGKYIQKSAQLGNLHETLPNWESQWMKTQPGKWKRICPTGNSITKVCPTGISMCKSTPNRDFHYKKNTIGIQYETRI